MSEPNEFLVVQAVQTALQAIAVAGGYFFNVAGAAVKLDPNQGVEALAAPDGLKPFIVIEVQPDSWSLQKNFEAGITLPFRLHWFCDTDATDDADKLRTYSRGLADIEKALVTVMRTPGGNNDVKWLSPISRGMFAQSASSARLWAYFDISILVHRKFGQPVGS